MKTMSANTPIVVDLDGTLIRTDLLVESLCKYLIQHPLSFFKLVYWLLVEGKSGLKSKLSQMVEIDIAMLPYNEELVAWLKEQKSAGRQLVLATASHQTYAQKVANHLTIFEAVFGTTNDVNLKSKNKCELLVSKYGYKQFAYVGDIYADLPIWASCSDAYIIEGKPFLQKKLNSLGIKPIVFSLGCPSQFKSFIKSLRLHQWLKNLLIFLPLFAAQSYLIPLSVLQAVCAFFIFGITASSAYLLNDLVDVENDRHHPSKKLRPFAAGNLNLLVGWVASPVLLILAFSAAYLLMPNEFIAVLFLYLIATLAYSFKLKKIVLVDVLVLAALYTIRIIAGAAATGLPLSLWLLSFSMFFFLSLALMKRFSELQISKDANSEKKLRGRGYLPIDFEAISSMGIASGYVSVLVLGLYFQDEKIVHMYKNASILWFTCPIFLFWVSRMWLLTHRGEMDHDPVYFAAKDKCSWFVIFLICAVFFAAKTF